MSLYRPLYVAIIRTVCILARRYPIPPDIAAKTYEYYRRVLLSMTRDLYRGDISESEFVTQMADLIQQQLTRAWHEGMRTNGLDPVEDMEEDWLTILDEIILSEYNYVDAFAADIVDAWNRNQPWEPLLARAELWANRYNDVVNQAIMATKEQKLKWIYGDTEHCETCAALNGIVAWASEWELSGVEPQNPPNAALTCGGWKCKCRLEPTTERKTRNAFSRIMAVP